VESIHARFEFWPDTQEDLNFRRVLEPDLSFRCRRWLKEPLDSGDDHCNIPVMFTHSFLKVRKLPGDVLVCGQKIPHLNERSDDELTDFDCALGVEYIPRHVCSVFRECIRECSAAAMTRS
jgi:hypothetical protein